MPTMQITIDLPVNDAGEFMIPVRKIGGQLALRPNDISAENHTRVWLYGATQISNDSHASVKVDPEKMSDDELRTAYEHVRAAIDKRWDAIYSGEWRVRAANGETADPTEREALSMAREATRAAYATARKANAKLPKWGDIDEAKRDAAARGFFDKNRESLMAKAKARLAEKRDAATGIDLADLGL